MLDYGSFLGKTFVSFYKNFENLFDHKSKNSMSWSSRLRCFCTVERLNVSELDV